ncbi:hypothetical protein N566_20200 [Streptomycetaceae bacterium MP113-05]|nr:hypothetical protein N566_20200 [Streptomycetaceae bacterium MP113-05]
MAVLVCSLYVHGDGRPIDPGGYRLVRFPYGGEESYDRHGMHEGRQPDGARSEYPDERSGLIWPAADGWGDLVANIHWEAGGYTELRDRFVRDPLGLGRHPDSTGTDHRPPSPGMQCFTKVHSVFVHRDTPLGLKVAHNDDVPRRLIHAQFKLAIHV